MPTTTPHGARPSIGAPHPRSMPSVRGAFARGVSYLLPRLLESVISKRSSIGRTIDGLPKRMEKVARQCALILEMVDDARAGRTDVVPLRALMVGAAAILYATNPADLVPDALPVLGSLDDLAVVAVATHLIRRDLERYCAVKGHDLTDYF